MHIEVLFEKYLEKKSRAENHPDGTYVSAVLDEAPRNELFKWCKENNIPNLSEPSEYHATIIYSKHPCPGVKTFDFNLPIEARIKSWTVFNTQQGSKCLVAELESEDLKKVNSEIVKKFGATSDFPVYKPHVTVSYDYNKSVGPKEFPDIKLTFSKNEIKALDPNFTPKKAK